MSFDEDREPRVALQPMTTDYSRRTLLLIVLLQRAFCLLAERYQYETTTTTTWLSAIVVITNSVSYTDECVKVRTLQPQRDLLPTAYRYGLFLFYIFSILYLFFSFSSSIYHSFVYLISLYFIPFSSSRTLIMWRINDLGRRLSNESQKEI